MFTIIGGDGQEYGPASVEQIRAWLDSGRANLETRACKAGEGEWRPLGEFDEFRPSPGTPPPLVAAGPALAGLGARLGGAFVDGCLVVACQTPFALAVLRRVKELSSSGTQPDLPEIMEVVRSAASLAYPYLIALAVVQAILIALRSQSVGKILLGTRIVLAADGSKANFVRAFVLRSTIPTAIGNIPIVGGLFWLVDTCFIFRDDRRCLHDLIAGTKVVKD